MREPRRDGVASQQDFGGEREGERVSGGEIQARIQQVRAAIEAAKAAGRPDLVKTEVIICQSTLAGAHGQVTETCGQAILLAITPEELV